MGVVAPSLIMKSIIPVVMAGILGIYGMIVAVILGQKIKKNDYDFFRGYAHLAAVSLPSLPVLPLVLSEMLVSELMPNKKESLS